MFLFRYLHQTMAKPKVANAAFTVYLSLLLCFDLFLAIDIFLSNGEDCTESTDWQILALISVDTIQSVLLIIVAWSSF